VIPPQARIVGVQPESSFLNPHVMTLGQFLEASKNMEKIHAIRVPLDDKKHVQMIERLAGNSMIFHFKVRRVKLRSLKTDCWWSFLGVTPGGSQTWVAGMEFLCVTH